MLRSQSQYPLSANSTRIVAELDRQRPLPLVDEAETSVALSKARCARLRLAILKWAFEGKLADQNPVDKPARLLLERIRLRRRAPKAPPRIGSPRVQ